MCGIAGIIAYRSAAPPVNEGELVTIRDFMAKRGPDGSGLWRSQDQRAGLAHRRLAIIDLNETGAQPMSVNEGRFHITFNGEIYNYVQLRNELVAKGCVFRSTSDTEVLLRLYADRGAAMVEALRGMYAFAIWDERDKTLFLARDPFGIKPLYYADDGKTFRFASQVKAMVAAGTIDTTIDAAGHVGFFVMGSVPEPFTLYRNIRCLPAGSTLTLERESSPTINRYFDVAQETARINASSRELGREEAQSVLHDALRDSVRHHMVADVPVGLFLSSGLDSSTVAALACQEKNSQLHSVTLGFLEYRGTESDEVPLAAVTARHLGTRHGTRWVRREVFEAEFEKLLAAMDQPSIDGVNTYFVSKAAADLGMKVALSGLGGDELFGGYPSFVDVPRITRRMGFARHMPWIARMARRLSANVLSPFASPKFASLLEYGSTIPGAYLLRRGLYMPWELDGLLDPKLVRDGWEELDLMNRLSTSVSGISNDRQRVSALEMSWYMRNQLLRDADWAGMAHSLEIRVPFVDVNLFRCVMPLVGSARPPTKIDAAHVPTAPLPKALFFRRKTGFSIPVHEWTRQSHATRGSRRQLRHWARIVHQPYKPMRVLALLSDAFGGHGGIALYNRDLLTSLCQQDNVAEVVALPRVVSGPLETLPEKLAYCMSAANNKLSYLREFVRLMSTRRRFDVVICSHINLLAPATIAKLRFGAPMIAFIYGIDAWTRLPLARRVFLPWVDRFVSISETTRANFQAWSNVRKRKITLLPNAIHAEWYGLRPKNPDLIRRYGIENKRILMTLGRLVSSERYKGFDEVLDIIPDLVAEFPDLVYMIVGDGSDKGRLEQRVADMGLGDYVRFTGRISESEKADHFRLADAYVMPSRGEGFGFVLLEAMACGVPVVASALDGGREAILDGAMGTLVDPDDPQDIRRGIVAALNAAKGSVPPRLAEFSYENFGRRAKIIVDEVVLHS